MTIFIVMSKYLTVIIPLLIISISCAEKTIKSSELLMGTIWDITIVDKDEKKVNKGVEEIFNEVKRIEKIASLYNSESELNKINNYSGKGPIKVSDDILNIIKVALELSKMSNGGFDITVGPVVKLWGFAGGKEHIPSEEEIKKAHSLVGYKLIKVDYDKKELTLLKKGMILDLGGIAKGYAIDCIRKVILKYNIKNIMISAGGQIFVLGHNPEGSLWKIGVKHPRQKNRLLTTLKETNKCISTSGDYERYFTSKGKLYHHIFNPLNLMPVSDTVSVTVIVDSNKFELPSTLADGLSTTVFVMGSKEGIKLLKKLNIEGIIVKEVKGELKVTLTDGLVNKLNFNY